MDGIHEAIILLNRVTDQSPRMSRTSGRRRNGSRRNSERSVSKRACCHLAWTALRS